MRYGLAVVAVAAGWALRHELTERLGPGLPTFVTFYPGIMVAALVAGLGPGLAATALTVWVVGGWGLPTTELFEVSSPAHRVSLVLFGGMGLFMSAVAEVHRRSRRKAAAYDQERALNQARREKAEELQRLNRSLVALARSNEALMRAAEEPAYLEEVTRIIVEVCGHAMVWIGFAEDDEGKTVRPAAWAGFEEGYLATLQVTWADTERGRGPTGTAIRAGKPCVCLNMLADPRFAPWREQAVQRGYASSLALPLRDGARVFGALTIYAREPEAFSGGEVELLGELADDLARGIAALRLRVAHARAEAGLRESQERFRKIFDHAATGIAITDAAGRFVQCNEAYSRLTGYSQAELCGLDFPSLIHSEDREANMGLIRSLLAGERPWFDIENRYFHKTGCVVWVHKHVSVLRDERGQPSHIVALVTDTTERRQTEEVLRFLGQSGASGSGEGFFKELARCLAQTLGMDCVRIDRLAEAPRGARALAVFRDGRFHEEGGRAWEDTPAGQAPGQGLCCVARDARGRFPQDALLEELQAESYLGATLWSGQGRAVGSIEAVGRQPLAGTGAAEAILHLVAVRAAVELERVQAVETLWRAHDELDQRVQERTLELRQTNQNLCREIQARRQTEQELIEAQESYRTVAEFTYDWEYWETPGSALRYCSPSCERITGYSAREFIDDPPLLERIVHPDDAGLWRKHREESQATAGHRVIQFRVRTKEGAVRWLEHAWLPVVGDDGRFMGIRASNRDITGRKEEELQTQQLREELAHVSRATTAGQLAASLAHELNQPLTAILSNAQTARELLEGAAPDIAEAREALGDIAGDSQRAGGVIQRLRALFNKSGHQRSLLQVNDVIRETLDLLRSEFVLKGVSAQTGLAPGLPRVHGNRIELQQVVLNLIVNAIEAMDGPIAGPRSLQVLTGCDGPGRIRVAVRDSGAGIRVEPPSRLFEPFFTTKPAGMGMGLAISQSILEAHGGRLEAFNNPGPGATFQLILPAHEDPAPAAQPAGQQAGRAD